MTMHHRNSRIYAFVLLLSGILALTLARSSGAQTPPAAQQAPAPDDDTAVSQTDRQHSGVAQNSHEAWEKLTSAVHDTRHPDTRIQALAALGTMGANPIAEKLIMDAMKDPEVDVRTAAVLSAGQTKDRNLATAIRSKLDDQEPQVAFIAATTLWKMNDHSGEDILIAVVDGERRATAGLKDSTMHTVSKDLHSPSTLARIGALQGASVLLGPFGFGITAYEYMRKNGGDSARVTAIEQLAEEKTGSIRSTLIAALADKDPALRAAAAKALGGSYHDKAASDALLPLFDDSKQPVRLTAAAAYLHSTESVRRERPAKRKQ